MPLLALDLDGTLISCQHRQLAVLRAASPPRVGLDLEAVWRAKRRGATTLQALVQRGISPLDAEQIASRWEAMIEELQWLSLDSLFVDSARSLVQLRDSGWHTILVTARRDKAALAQQLRHLGIADLVGDVIAVDPRALPEAKAEVLCRFRPLAMIGDTEADALSASRAQVIFVAVSTGQRCEQFLKARGIATVLSTLGCAVSAVRHLRP